MKEILKYLKGTFNNGKEKHPKSRGIYVVLKGTYSGEFFVFINQTTTYINFISLPDKIKRIVPLESFYNGLANGVIEYLENLPVNVFKTVEEEYKNINTINEFRHSNKDNKSNKRSASCP